MFKYYDKWKKYNFKKRFLISASLLFLCGFLPAFLLFIFFSWSFGWEFHTSELQYFYYSLLYGCIGILVALFYSFTYKYKLATALCILFVLVCLLYLIRSIITIILPFIIGM